MVGTWAGAGAGTMRHTRLGDPHFGAIIITRGILHSTTILFTIPIDGATEIRIGTVGMAGDIIIPTTELVWIEDTLLPLGTAG